MEDTKGITVASENICDVLELGLWCNKALPRLVIRNRISGSKRMSPVSWLEKESRKLTMKGEDRKTVVLPVSDLTPAVRTLMKAFTSRPVFKALLWRTTMLVSDTVHTPKAILDPGELSLLPETKRGALWIADLTKSRDNGRFRPCFPLTEDERGVLPVPPELPITDGKGLSQLKATGVTRRLVVANPDRWYRPLLLTSGALLCGFSVNFEDMSETASTLWDLVRDGQISGREFALATEHAQVERMIRSLVVYMRHLPLLDGVSESFLRDGYDALKERGYSRRRRIPFPAGAIGPVEYKVTLCEHAGNGTFALVAAPEGLTDRHEGDIILEMPMNAYGKACDSDAFGGARDEYDTIANLFSAVSFNRWIESVSRFLDGILPSLV